LASVFWAVGGVSSDEEEKSAILLEMLVSAFLVFRGLSLRERNDDTRSGKSDRIAGLPLLPMLCLRLDWGFTNAAVVYVRLAWWHQFFKTDRVSRLWFPRFKFLANGILFLLPIPTKPQRLSTKVAAEEDEKAPRNEPLQFRGALAALATAVIDMSMDISSILVSANICALEKALE